jgi:hypothetical protein
MPLFLDLDWLFNGFDLSRLIVAGLQPLVEAGLAGPAAPRSLFDNGPTVTTSPPPPAPVLPDKIDWGGFFAVDLATEFNAIVATVNSLVMEYTNVFADLSQLIGNWSELNFANFLPIDVGNTFSNPADNPLLAFGNSLLDAGNLSQALGDLETFLGVDIVPGNGLPPNAGLVQGLFSPGGLGVAIEPLFAELTANPFVANILTAAGQLP